VTRPFLVLAVSTTHNSFGLKGVVIVSKGGDAYEVGMTIGGVRPIPASGSVLQVETDWAGRPQLHRHGWELCRPLGKPPASATLRAWRAAV
jgi:hypothetical protein